ncbi:aspartate aminotransferase family protein [Streptomyces sp. NBC_00454]|uniref:aminotransferase family protein n=1 Tax=Streptomyces sp. NBC_00454 TaxID=2975747 RepID=UPI0030E11D1C
MTTVAPSPGRAGIPASALPVAVRARGVRVYDEDGRGYIDGSSGPICVNIGHSVPEILKVMREQAEEITFVHRSQFAHRAVEALTSEILSITGSDFREVVYTNSGSEATETALRLAMLHHHRNGQRQRDVVLTQFPSYHGMTAGALGVSGHPARRAGLEPLHDRTASTLPVSSSDPERLLPDAGDWERAFAEVGPDRVAAVMVEPVGGASSGAAELPDSVFRRIEELCREHGALLISDEVMTGFGRVGQWFGYRRANVVPDLIVTGKGLSAGYTPIGACVVGQRVLAGQSAADLAFGHTMSGNPLSAATALAVLQFTREHRLPERAEQLHQVARARLTALSSEFSFLGEPRGRGLLQALSVNREHAAAAKRSGTPLPQLICTRARERGLILYPAGAHDLAQSVLIAPPLTIGCADLDLLFTKLESALRAVATELAEGGES